MECIWFEPAPHLEVLHINIDTVHLQVARHQTSHLHKHASSQQRNQQANMTSIPSQIVITSTLSQSNPTAPSQTFIDKWSLTIGKDCLDKEEAIKQLFPTANPATSRLVWDREFESIAPEGPGEGTEQRRSFKPSEGPRAKPFDPDVTGQQRVPGALGEIYTLENGPVSPLLSPVLSPIGTPSVTEEKVTTTTTTTTTQNRDIPASSPPITYSPPLTPPDTPLVMSPPLVYSSPLATSVAAPGVVTPPIVSPLLLSPPLNSSVRNTSTYQTGVVSPPAGREVRTDYFA